MRHPKTARALAIEICRALIEPDSDLAKLRRRARQVVRLDQQEIEHRREIREARERSWMRERRRREAAKRAKLAGLLTMESVQRWMVEDPCSDPEIDFQIRREGRAVVVYCARVWDWEWFAPRHPMECETAEARIAALMEPPDRDEIRQLVSGWQYFLAMIDKHGGELDIKESGMPNDITPIPDGHPVCFMHIRWVLGKGPKKKRAKRRLTKPKPSNKLGTRSKRK